MAASEIKHLTPDRYAVIGNPVEHSLSPVIHSLFARQTGQAIVYEKLLAPRDGFRETVIAFRDSGAKGANVTVPFKQQAYELADGHSWRARQATAANTLVFHEDRTVFADNTDGAGLILDISEHLGRTLTGRRVLLIGAGGAVRGVLGPILAEHPACVTVVNRTLATAVDLARDFSGFGEVEVVPLQEVELDRYDWIINGTSASLQGVLPPLPEAGLRPETVVYDMMYSKAGTTVFTEWARRKGCRHVYDGLGMLVGQAAESFYLWRGIRPRIGSVVAELRSVAG